MPSSIPPVKSYRVLALYDAHTSAYSAIVRSPFQLAQVPGPDHKPRCGCQVPRHQKFHGIVHATPDETKLHIFFDVAILLSRLDQLFVVKGNMYDPRFEAVNEVAGKRFLVTKAFVSSHDQKHRLKNAYANWQDIEVLVVPDLYERVREQRDIEETDDLSKTANDSQNHDCQEATK